MNKMNNKGFLLAESLIVATFVLTVLIYLFSQFKNLMIEYKKNYQYNTVENIYNLGSISKYIKQNNLIITNNKYIFKEGNCTSEIPDEKKAFFKSIATSMNIDYIIFTDSNMDYVKNNMSSYDQDMQDFIERISTKNIEGKGRLLAKFKNGNFATIVTEKDYSPIIKSWEKSSAEDFHSSLYKPKITSINFLNTSVIPATVVQSWDVSDNNNKSVMAWITNDGTGGYNLYIGGEGGVIAHQNSSNLFYNFTGLRTINFNNYFYTSDIKNMNSMFENCTNLTSIDLSSFNTSYVTETNGMFKGNSKLTTIYSSDNFITTNITSSNSMFSDCTLLVGENGTRYNSSKTNKEYARIDKPTQPGYFTQK